MVHNASLGSSLRWMYEEGSIDTEHWEKVFHDFGGLAMMPLALGIIVLELWLLSNLVVKHDDDGDDDDQDGRGKSSGVVHRARE